MSVFQYWNQLTDSERLLAITIFVAIYPQLKDGITQICKSVYEVLETFWNWTYRWVWGFFFESVKFYMFFRKFKRWINWIVNRDKPISKFEDLISRYIWFGRFKEYKPPIDEDRFRTFWG